MDKRYQVFVSSTFKDLKEERQKVIQALLGFDCIPVGMEIFPAADGSAWEIIKSFIDNSDYYIVIVAGRYGSLTAEGISYTQKEYEYAIKQGIPVMAFLHESPNEISLEKSELDKEAREKLEVFRDLCRKKLCKTWNTSGELSGVVLMSLNQMLKNNPKIGWVKADQVPSESSTKDILNLKNKVESLENELEKARIQPPKDTEDLAQGKDEIIIKYTVTLELIELEKHSLYKTLNEEISVTWDNIFFIIGPKMINDKSQEVIIERLNNWLHEMKSKHIHYNYTNVESISHFEFSEDSFHTIIIQFRSLGLIEQGNKQRSLKDTKIYWKLTSYGDSYITKLRAIKHKEKN